MHRLSWESLQGQKVFFPEFNPKRSSSALSAGAVCCGCLSVHVMVVINCHRQLYRANPPPPPPPLQRFLKIKENGLYDTNPGDVFLPVPPGLFTAFLLTCMEFTEITGSPNSLWSSVHRRCNCCAIQKPAACDVRGLPACNYDPLAPDW